jgi:hypothetical protein
MVPDLDESCVQRPEDDLRPHHVSLIGTLRDTARKSFGLSRLQGLLGGCGRQIVRVRLPWSDYAAAGMMPFA